MWLTKRERACLIYLGEKGTVSADALTIGRAILCTVDHEEWGWTGEVIAGSLKTRGLVETWTGRLVMPAATHMWAITPKGRVELRQNRPSPNESSPVESDRHALNVSHDGR